MRVLQVRFKNLNSLVGEWAIDLTHPAYTSEGIFAITGPTGAGKSTILDAICLALYGRTPRLTKITKSANEIMSRQSGECFAEVTFETPAGRYRCHWSQHRARKRAGGELQSPRHEIADADSGKIFESKIRGVAAQIEAATGMDFDRFTRSMLLAQGGFAAFLQAAPDERAPILEQITGTEIYSQISIRVHERQREEREKLNLLQAETAGIVTLEPEQEIAIHQELEARQRDETDLTTSSADTGKAITWLRAIDGLREEIISLADEASKLQSDIAAFTPARDRLTRATKAASLDGSYATLTVLRKEQADDLSALRTGAEALAELESSAKEQAEALILAEHQSVKAKEERQAAAPLIQKVRALDQRLAAQKEAVLEGERSCNKDAAKIDVDKQVRHQEREKRAAAEKQWQLAESYLKAHAQDEWLISGLAGVEEQLGSLLSRQKDIAQKEADQEQAVTALEQSEITLDACQKQSATRKQELEDAAKRLRQGKDTLNQLLGDRLLREYRTEKETLLREMAFLAKIAELEEHRGKLEDGKPCPLCGATEHPFAIGNVPVPGKTEQKIEALSRVIGKAEDQEAAIKILAEAEVTARTNLTEGEKQEATAASDKRAAERALAELREGLEKLRNDFTELKQAVSARLQPLGITEGPMPSLLETLRERLKAWQSQANKKAEVEKQIAEIGSGMQRLDAVIETQSDALIEKRGRLAILKQDHATGSDERKELYGDKHPDDEERRLNIAVVDAEKAEKRASTLNFALQQKLASTESHVESLKKRIEQRDRELKSLEAEFTAALETACFADEQQFLEARLSAERRDNLSAKAKKLDDSQTDLKARQKDRETRLATEIAKQVTDKPLEELEAQYKAYEEALRQLRDTIASHKHRLSENSAAKERIKAKRAAIEAQKKECRRWETLHELIGSADGKKYRNFAQGLTFEIVIGHANGQLQKMTDRYLLIRDDARPLELNVIDNYQAGEIRSTKNLSGGESFIVSLSLALGLSHMASKHVRVDSLFLDEGFGTLDEEALDTALETLAGLQQEGKLIGVISHVPALKERIGTQIQVIPQTGGRSLITGPGCTKV